MEGQRVYDVDESGLISIWALFLSPGFLAVTGECLYNLSFFGTSTVCSE